MTNVIARKLSGRSPSATNRTWMALGMLVGILSLASVGCDSGSSTSPKTGTAGPTATATGTAGPTPTSSTTPTAGPTPTGSSVPTPTSTGTPVACLGGLRQLNVINDTTQPVWVSGGGGALRAICVINGGASSCLSSPSGGACACGGTAGTLTCPTATSAPANSGKNCSCNADADCGAGAGCNTATHLCYFTLPSPTGFTGFTPSSPWNWELPASGDTATFCLAQATVSFSGTSVPSAVWWSGGVGARTGCQPDGTSCLTGDCNTSVAANGNNPVPNANCPVGVGGAQPATIAEFTLQSTATDFYDVTLINGANVGEQMAPIPTATQTPGSVDPAYWCATPGGSCNFNLGQYTSVVPLPAGLTTDYTALLMLTGQPCTVGSTTGCPSASYTCSGTTGALNGVCYQKCTSSSQCSTGLQCLPAGDGNSYCQCSAQSDCPAGQFCGSQFVPGIGGTPPLSPQVYLQQCGSFQGWWTADDLCGNANNLINFNGSAVLNCGGSITDGDSNQTNIASLFGCNGASSSTQAGNVANEASCYNSSASPTAGCCGCATESTNPLSTLWPIASGSCANNDPIWASNVQPWLANLKQACPSAYSYPFDDFTSTFQCQAQGATNMLGYNIEFTPLVAPTSE